MIQMVEKCEKKIPENFLVMFNGTTRNHPKLVLNRSKIWALVCVSDEYFKTQNGL